MVLVLVDGPDGSLDVLHAHEALVQAQVVADGVLRVQEVSELVAQPTPCCPPPATSSSSSSSSPSPWWCHHGHLQLGGGQTLCGATRGCGENARPVSTRRVLGAEVLSQTQATAPFREPWPNTGHRGRWDKGQGRGTGTRDTSRQQGPRGTATVSAAARWEMLSEAG